LSQSKQVKEGTTEAGSHRGKKDEKRWNGSSRNPGKWAVMGGNQAKVRKRKNQRRQTHAERKLKEKGIQLTSGEHLPARVGTVQD